VDLEEFVRTALRSIIRGMRDLKEDGYKAEGVHVKGQEAVVEFKLSVEAMEDGKIRVARIQGRANPVNFRTF